MTGSPFVMRFATGLRTPRNPVPGTDVAGTVEAVGADVTTLRPGDEVFGWCAGAFAEFASAPEGNFIKKPANLTFEQAAAVGVSATTALQLLRDTGKVQAGQTVLVNGASGGVGSFAVQIAKALGAEVTGVTSTKNVELVRSIGADHVIDYTREDFTAGGPRYDLILDNVGNLSMARTRRALTPSGTLISNGGGHANGKLGRTIRAMLVSLFVKGQAGPTVKTENHDDLVALKDLVEAGSITPVIDGTYPLEETPRAIDRVAAGHTRGTIVITVATERQRQGRSGPLDHADRRCRADRRLTGRAHRQEHAARSPRSGEEHTMSKATVTRLFIGGLIAFGAGAIVAMLAIALAIANDVFVMAGTDIAAIQGGALAWALIVIAILGGLAAAGGAVAGFVAWIGAVLNTWQLESKAWFVGLVLLGVFNFGFVAMIAYVIAGPDGKVVAAGRATPVPIGA